MTVDAPPPFRIEPFIRPSIPTILPPLPTFIPFPQWEPNELPPNMRRFDVTCMNPVAVNPLQGPRFIGYTTLRTLS